MPDERKTTRIRELNDQLRRDGLGGTIVMTRGIRGLGGTAVATLFSEIRNFEDFSENNDPYGEHDCAIMTVAGHKIIWKIDYYDPSLQWHSDDPSDPEVTRRVMTVMLAEEY